ncbi:UDP-N-acetylglucosamine 2-epimerase [Photorhabdus heterorhabditis]|uniref:UDP-N-acetylglucosamine 2-epimerase n=1 Tax=Photorhabdus heterorhabditis TaxID=880156 RepID=UPI001C2754DB|nr:UDP-N-acetylglucosamine 2-epimerase [Photorhabdus heterorhabditis]
MKKIAVILDTRPEAIKYGPVINALKKDFRFKVIVISTGQHKEMLDDALAVHGGTGTTLAAALSGFHHHIPVIHIEAGLRSGNTSSLFPEEGNRKLVAQIAAWQDVRIIIPMHKNPVVCQTLQNILADVINVDLIEPLNYLDFCQLMSRVDIILSDSSGAEE